MSETTVAATRDKKARKAVDKNFNTLEHLRIYYIPHEMISPNAYNPNRQSEHDFELLLRSMGEDGFTQPIVTRPLFEHSAACKALGISEDTAHKDVDWLKAAITLKSGFMVVDGEHRWKASKVLGFKEVPCAVVNMTDAQMRIATLRHNRARGSEDFQLSAQVLKDLEKLGALDHAQDSLMLDDTEIQAMLNDAGVIDDLGKTESFGQAWEPNTALIPNSNPKGGFDVGLTTKAIEEQRRIQQATDNARTTEERQMIQRSSDLIRIMFVFQGDESKLVKRVLGKEQGEKLLELCRRELEANPQLYGEG